MATSGAAWLRQGCALALYIVGARTLAAEDLGAFALASAFLLVTEYAFHDSISEAVVQRPALEPGHRRAALVLGLTASAVVIAFAWLAAAPLGLLFRSPDLAAIFLPMSLGVALICATSVHVGLIRRAARLHLHAAIISGAAIASTALAVVLLLRGHGLQALVAYFLLEKALLAAACVLAALRLQGATSARRHFRDLAIYAVPLAGQRSVSYARTQVDRIVIGLLWGPEILGAYQLAAKVFESISAAFLTPATKVFFIVFSRLQNDKARLARAFIAALSLVALASLPAFLGLSAIAERAVPILFGEQWTVTSRLLEVIALAGLPMTFSLMSGALLSGLGRASAFLQVELATALLGAVLIVAVSGLGMAWIPFAILAREVLAAVFHVRVIRADIDLRQVWRGLTGLALLLALILYAALLLLDPVFPPDSVTVLLAIIVIGSAVYAAFVTLFFRKRIQSEVEILQKVHEIDISSSSR